MFTITCKRCKGTFSDCYDACPNGCGADSGGTYNVRTPIPAAVEVTVTAAHDVRVGDFVYLEGLANVIPPRISRVIDNDCIGAEDNELYFDEGGGSILVSAPTLLTVLREVSK